MALLLTTGCASNRWVRLAVHDAREVVTAPAEASPQTWRRAAVVTGAVVATALLDEPARDLARSSQNARADEISKAVTPFGGRYSDRVMIGFLAVGLIGRNERAKAVAFDSFVTSVLASKIITPVLKQAIGRDRPHEAAGPADFGGGSSFPSNHATQAFGVASVIASHHEAAWVDITAYGLATLVAGARVYDDVHWLSDVVAGAVIGTATGKFIVRTNDRYRATWTVVPLYTADRRGVLVRISR